jgi:hypothetical protein
MKKLKPFIAIAGAAVLVTALLAGCTGGGDSPATDPNPESPPSETPATEPEPTTEASLDDIAAKITDIE